LAQSSAALFDVTSPVSIVCSIRQNVVTAYRWAQAVSRFSQANISGRNCGA